MIKKIAKNTMIKQIVLTMIIAVMCMIAGRLFTTAGVKTFVDGIYGADGIPQTTEIGFSYSGLLGEYPSGDSRQFVYCVDHGGSVNFDVVYEVKDFVKITGNVAERNGVKTPEWKENGKLAYILGGGSNAKGYGKSTYGRTNRQYGLWRMWNWWNRVTRETLGMEKYESEKNAKDFNDSRAIQMENEAEAYAMGLFNNSNNVTKASISSMVGNTIITSNTIAGPFRIKYTGTISQFDVNDKNGNRIDNAHIYSDASATKQIAATDIKSGEDFYIKNGSNSTLGSLKIKASAKSEGVITAKIWILEAKNYKRQRLIVAEAYPNPTNSEAEVTINIKPYTNLIITKKDKDTGAELNGAKFKIRTVSYGDKVGATSGGTMTWLAGAEGSYQYDRNVNGAKEYDANTTIKDLEFGTYEIYEVKAPDGYDLTQQVGNNGDVYDSTKKWVRIGKVELTGSTETVTVPVINEKSISIEGYVWVDQPGTKANDYNSIYDNGESRVAGVAVELVEKGTNRVIDTQTTDAEGRYKFKDKVLASKLSNYYVRFNYSNTTITTDAGQKSLKQYIPVAFSSEANGSKALADNIPTADADLKGIATTYPTQGGKESTYGLSALYGKLFNSSNNTLENINLGIKKIPDTQYKLEQDLAYVKVKIKGYTYTYNYREKENKNAIAAPRVQIQSKDSVTREIYPSDISYSEMNPSAKDRLEMYAVYRIDVTNTNNKNIEELYQEKELHITKLENEYDSNRYELEGLNDKDQNEDFSKWSGSNGKIEYKGNKFAQGIKLDETRTVYVQFKIKYDAIKAVLTAEQKENMPTKATSSGYHTYTRKDYSWQNDITKPQTHTTESQDRTDDAPYLILKLGEERTLKGKVFEDKVETTNGEKLGNGKYDENEKVAKAVKVELLDTDLKTSHLYKVRKSENILENNRIEYTLDAITTTGEDGTYELSGVVPGKYYLKFTYGDGTYKITDTNGQEVKFTTQLSDGTRVDAKKYKSTIVTESNVKTALENSSNDNYVEWYKSMEGDNYSVAVDDLNQRKDLDNDKVTYTEARTAKLSITVENTKFDSTQVDDENNGQNEVFGGFNFGIITIPEQKATISKEITNMKLTNAQNNTVFEGNPATLNTAGVSDLSATKSSTGSTFVRAEMNDEAVYGSTLDLTFGITVTNESDINYYGDDYYKYGTAVKTQEVTLTPNKVEDNMDSTLKYTDASFTDGSTITVTPSTSEKAKARVEGEISTPQETLEITGWKTLYTNKNVERAASTTSQTASLSAQRLLSSQDQDMEFVNEAEIAEISRTSDPTDTTADKANQVLKTTLKEVDVGEPSKATITITPPTGEDRQTLVIYIAVGAIALAVLSTGLVIIKKKVV